MKKISLFLLTGFMLLLVSQLAPAMAEEEPWPGVDVTVVEKYATQAGRPPREPYINTDQGDLLLFLFAVAGSIGGFVAGYYWRELFGKDCIRGQRTESLLPYGR